MPGTHQSQSIRIRDDTLRLIEHVRAVRGEKSNIATIQLIVEEWCRAYGIQLPSENPNGCDQSA